MTILSTVASMFRRVQNYLFDPGDDPELRKLHQYRRGRLTAEQKLRRKKIREKMLRRQGWIIPEAKPPKKRKPTKRRRRSARSRNRRPVRRERPDRVLKRQYKPLESPLYNLPAALVDKLSAGKINLKLHKHRRYAHRIADAVARLYIERDCMDPDDIKAMHDAIDKLAENPLPIATQLADIRRVFEARAAEVQDGWSQHHRDKVNNYYMPPLEVDRVEYEDGATGVREVFE